jgi:AmmeMemoRadiSam system protein B
MRRRAAVAGSWYPDEPVRLALEVDRYVRNAASEPLPSLPRALIAPHAGLMYSGPVAAYAYSAVRTGGYSSIVLVGPSHFVPFEGTAIWPDGDWDTPFGPVTVNADLAESIRAASEHVIDLPAAHRREHSLEMQLPFIARLLPGTPIVPLVMGLQTRSTSFELGDALADAIARYSSSAAGERVLIVASSDLSHYEDAQTAGRMDAVVAQHVDTFDPEGLMTALEREPRHACGGGPMVAVLTAARRGGASRARVLHYADSGDVSGDKSSVVGYMAAAVW